MTVEEIKAAVEAGKQVFWKTRSYRVIKSKFGRFEILDWGGNCVSLTWSDGQTLNGKPADFFVAEGK